MEPTMALLVAVLVIGLSLVGLGIASIVILRTGTVKCGEDAQNGQRTSLLPFSARKEKAKTMHEIAKQAGTDKFQHKYTEHFYPIHFEALRYSPVKLLEVGINRGNSLALWNEYFTDVDLHAIDIEDGMIDGARKNFPKAKIDKVDMENVDEIKKYVEKHGAGTFDIVLDDGGHTMKQQMNALIHLLPLVKPGGMFVMEDVHTSMLPNGGQQYGVKRKNYADSCLYVIQNILGRRPGNSVDPDYVSKTELDYLKSKIRGGESFLYENDGSVIMYIV